MEQNLPKTCRVHFEDPHKLHRFTVTITPDEGYWLGGRFKFHIDVPEDYNIVVRVSFEVISYAKQLSLVSGNLRIDLLTKDVG